MIIIGRFDNVSSCVLNKSNPNANVYRRFVPWYFPHNIVADIVLHNWLIVTCTLLSSDARALECFQCGARAAEKNASATPTSRTSNRKRAAVSRRPVKAQRKQNNGRINRIMAFFCRFLHFRSTRIHTLDAFKSFALSIEFGQSPEMRLFMCSKGNLKPTALPHVLACFPSFARILHVVWADSTLAQK